MAWVKQLLSFVWGNKAWWIVPIVLLVVAVGLFVLLADSPVALPFVYAEY